MKHLKAKSVDITIPTCKPVDYQIEQAVEAIGQLALRGKLDYCAKCGHRQGYIFYAAEVREVLRKLVSHE
jgi:hypothetical protein